MAKIIECIPNVSEGRRTEVVEALVNVVRTVPGVTLLDYSSDASHNRLFAEGLLNEAITGA